MSDFILAASPSFSQVGAGLAVLAALLSVLLLGIKVKQAIVPVEKKPEQISPLPLPISVTAQFATKEELQEVKADLKQLEKDLPKTEKHILAAIERTSERILKKVDTIGSAGASGRRDLHEKSNRLGERVARVETELDDFKEEFKS